MNTRKCSECKEEKLETEFYSDRSKKLNKTYKCKTCIKALSKHYYHTSESYKKKKIARSVSYTKKKRNGSNCRSILQTYYYYK
jgi:hypothetical protein